MRNAYMGDLGAGVEDWLTGAAAIWGTVAKLVAKPTAEKAVAEGKSPAEAREEAAAAAKKAVAEARAVDVQLPVSRIILYAGGGAAVVAALGGLAWFLLKK